MWKWHFLCWSLVDCKLFNVTEGPSLSWLHGSWINNYLCNQCQITIKVVSLNLFMTRCTRYNIIWLVTGQWFSPGILVSSTNKTDPHDITEILLKVLLSTINQTKSCRGIHDYLPLYCPMYYLYLQLQSYRQWEMMVMFWLPWIQLAECWN
jgi:hypothetical protein